MPDEKRISEVAAETNQAQLEILYLLADTNDGPALWTVEEIARELDNHDAVDLINELQRAGLIHRTSDGFVFATRSALKQIQLVGLVA
jgi:Mn-dependent DtxR family transcriptional regulator